MNVKNGAIDEIALQLLSLNQNINSIMPKTLYHYTNLNGMQGIVKSGCFWATNFKSLNDRANCKSI